MKIAKVLLAIALTLGAVGGGTAWADHGHSRVTFGINLGVPIVPWRYPPPYYYPPYYYPPYPPVVALPAYPNAVAVQPSAPVYVEKGSDAAGPSAPSSNYWYYCPNPQGYYPYVTECPSGWMTVLPQAPAQAGPR